MRFRLTAAVCLTVLFASAQYTTGRIEGTVLDASSAAVEGTEVRLQSAGTAIERTFRTGADGGYSFAAVPPGRYRISIEKVGFAPVAVDVEVSISQTVTQPFVLQPATSSTSLEVVATAEGLDAADPVRSVSRTSLEVHTLPNLGRNAVALLSLAPGVQPTFSPRGGALVTVAGAQAGQVAANGGRSKATSYQLDFTDANDWEFGGIALNTQPSPDMLQEIRILTSNWAAEYGVKSNAQVLMVTRSGSNEFHGTAYDFLQNDALNARDYLDRTGKPTPLKQNIYGVVAGGRLVRDRTFFFAGYEGRETRGAGSTVVATLPTAATRERAPSAAARELLARYLPLPTAPGPNAALGTLTSQLPNPVSGDMFLVRGDHYFTPSHSISARYFQHTSSSYLRLANTLPGFDATFDPDGKNAMLSDTLVLSSRTVNELRASYGRSSALFTPENNVLTPRFNITGLVSFGGVNNWPQGRIFNVYQLSDTLSHVHGRHAIKAGFDLRHIQDNSINDTNRRGVFTFTSLDAFLNGELANFTQRFGSTYRGFRTNFHGAFVQDDFRLTPTLTLSFGLRWEYQGGLRERNEAMAVLDPQLRGAVGAAGAGPLGAFRTESPIVESNGSLVAPRFGFSWNPGGRALVLRGGYGIYYDSLLFNGLQAGRYTPPVNYTGDLAGAQISGVNNLDALLAGTSPLQRSLEAQIGSFGDALNFGQIVTTDPRLRNPYSQHFQIGVQRSIGGGWIADVAYVGTKGTALAVYGPANSVLQRPAPAVSAADEAVRAGGFRDAVTGQNGPGNTRIDPRFNAVDLVHSGGSSIYHSLQTELRKRFSRGLTMNASYTWSKSIDNSSDYSPGQQTTDASFAQNQFDLSSERAVSNYDIPHRFVLTHVWRLPGLTGRRSIAWQALSGWVFSSINQVQSGIPATILAGPRLGITDVNADGNLVQGGDNNRANCLAGGDSFRFDEPSTVASLAERTSGVPGRFRYYQPLLGNFGTCGRNTERMSRLVNIDWSLAKEFRIYETGTVEFRSDFFNVFNIPFLTATGNEWRTLSSPQFGLANSAGASRRIQLALRFVW
ncbi:MAG TPA: TonB-dependent receptor [Bryobacteraceae bacterium]|nr:TonB-dependent receptor [Bryobacteraceae bacterium]